MKPVEKLFLSKVGIRCQEQVKSFEQIGWFDPEADPKVEARAVVEWLKSIKFETDLYPKHLMHDWVAPPCVFVPSQEILRKLIFTVAKAKKIEDLQAVFNAF